MGTGRPGTVTAAGRAGHRLPGAFGLCFAASGRAGGDSAELALKIDQTLCYGAILLEQHKLSGW